MIRATLPAPSVRRAVALAAAAAAILMLALVAGGGSATAAPQQPSLTATLTDDGACTFTTVVTWRGYQVDRVYAMIHHDGVWAGTMEAPSTGPNGGTLKGRTATFKAGAYVSTDTPHAWSVLVQLYSKAGAHLAETWTNIDSVNCTVPPQ